MKKMVSTMNKVQTKKLHKDRHWYDPSKKNLEFFIKTIYIFYRIYYNIYTVN